MDIEDFLVRYVEGYLFEDLSSMAKIKAEPGKTCGAAGYPMVSSALGGVELLGALTSATTFNKFAGDRYFHDFWERSLYPNPEDHRRAMHAPVYQLARHGLAHNAVAKPLIDVSKTGYPEVHLSGAPSSGALVIDCLVLAQDLKDAYFRDVKPGLSGALRATMQARLNEMRDQYSARIRRSEIDHRGSAASHVPCGRVRRVTVGRDVYQLAGASPLDGETIASTRGESRVCNRLLIITLIRR